MNVAVSARNAESAPVSVFDVEDRIAAAVLETRFEDLTPAAVKQARDNIRDGMAVALAATTTTPACRELAELAEEIGGVAECTVMGYGTKVPAHLAAWVNAALMHSLNYHDLFDAYWTHPGAILLPSALAGAEKSAPVSGKEFITAYTMGLEVMARLGKALFLVDNQRDWARHGWLPPQLFGYFGGAAVSGRLLGLSKDQLVSAMGLAYSQAGGTMEPLLGIASDKGIYHSHPALASTLAVQMARKGVAGPRASLVGKAGLFNVYFDGEYSRDELTKGLGETFVTEELGAYAYPCCGWTQVYVAIALQAARDNDIRPDQVAGVTLHVGPRATNLCEPLDVRRAPGNLTEAQMSIPFTVATALAKGKPRIQHFTPEGLRDPEILAMASRIDWKGDPSCDKTYGSAVIEAAMDIRLTSGETVHARHRGFRYGHPEMPLPDEERVEKVRDCLNYSVKRFDPAAVDRLIDRLDHLEEVEDMREIVGLIS